MTVAADASDEAAMSALFDRFGADLPPLGGIYLAAFGGGPVTLRDMTDDDVTAMFAPKLDVLSLLHQLSLKQPVRPVRVVLVDLRTARLALAGSLHGDDHLPRHLRLSRAEPPDFRPPPSTGDCGSRWPTPKATKSSTSPSSPGLEPMPDEVAIQALSAVTCPDAPVRSTIVAADWPRLATAYRTRASLRIVDDLLAAERRTTATVTAATPTTDFRDDLRQLRTDRAARLVARITSLRSSRR